MHSSIVRTVLVACAILGVACVVLADTPLQVGERYRRGDFKLVYNGEVANILVAPQDFKVVQLASNDLKADVERVAGQTPQIRTSATSEHAVIIGTLGHSPLIDSIVASQKLEVSQMQGKWESFLIATIPNPLPNVSLGLVIAGSDRRGTAYGVYELSQAIGVSPWNWWADVRPGRQTNLVVAGGINRFGPPSVKYRGIFLNDEDWGLQPWAAKTYEPEQGDIGPKTYARIFELLLRLKANTLWPAMHACTRPFNSFPENKQVADDYAIVMGSSHAEPMLRNNVGEWKTPPEEYDYTKNPNGVRKYWEDRVAENGRFENIYTIGMRGIHDSPIQGPKSGPERIALLQQIFTVQRELISRHAPEAPQIFCPYKEVLADYQNGLKVPDDVTIVFPDDNFGYLRYLPAAEERKRSGGFGVYYHISYLGRPLSYLWLNTTPPSLIWEEMSKAYEHGVDRFWMLNVGDLKPGEIGIEFFMEMAWDIKRWRRENLSQFLVDWARREFGEYNSNEIASIMSRYYELGFARKPEHLQWYLPNEKRRESDFSHIDYGDEAGQRLAGYDELSERVNRVNRELPAGKHDAFFELVLYPVRCAALANRRFFLMEKSELYARQGRARALELALEAERAGAEIDSLTSYFDGARFVAGKWRHMMSTEMTPGQWPSMRTTVPVIPESVKQMRVPDQAGLGVAIEGRIEAVDSNDAQLPPINALSPERRFIDVFNTGKESAAWTASANVRWLTLSQTKGDLKQDWRLWISVDWNQAPKTAEFSGAVEISAAGSTRTIRVPVVNPKRVGQTQFVESNGVVAIEAEHFTRKVDRAGVGWNVIPGLGRVGDSVSIFPSVAPSIDTRNPEIAPVLEYDIQLSSSGEVKVLANLLPTQPLKSGLGLRFAIGFDNEAPKVVTVGAGIEVSSREWAQNVLNATTIGASTLTISSPGPHVLKLYMIDAGVIVDRIVIDAGGLKPSYLGPRETKMGHR